jgi:hypothetical protein
LVLIPVERGGKATRCFCEKVTSLELWVLKATGAVLALVGMYYRLKCIFDIIP